MGCRFLRKGYDALLARIEEFAHAMRQAGEEKGLWAQQSAETWHDNFGYEQEEREQWTISERLESFVAMKNDAEIGDERVSGEVDIGMRVTIRDARRGDQRCFVVGSYQVLDRRHDDEIAYAAPLAQQLMGAAVGEEREVRIGDRTMVYRVMAIA